jgi:glycopeptide antibiotics resistance protein
MYGVGRTVDSLYPLLVAAMLLALAAWHPFDVALNLGGMWSDVRRFVADPLQMGVFADEGADALRHGLFGAAAVAWLRASGHRRAVLAGALAATAAACVLEGSQVFLRSRVPGLKDVFVGAAGGWVGALAAGSGMRFWPRWRLGLLVILLAWIAAAFIMLTPFDWAETRRPFGTLPFDSYYRRASGATVSHVVELVLAFFPIGFAVARVVPRWRMPAAVAAGLVLVWPLEYLQGWTASRVPDVTGPLVGVLGASLGAWMGGPIRHRFAREVSRPAHDCPPKRTPDPITEL